MHKSIDWSLKFVLFFLTVLASVGFFNYRDIISDQVMKLMFYALVGVSLVIGVKDGISLGNSKFPKTAYLILMAGIFVSSLMGSLFHMQSLPVSIMAVLPYLCAYAFIFAMLRFNIAPHQIMKGYIVLCAMSTIVYFCNAATVPDNIFGKPIIGEDFSRGIIRIQLVFIELFPLVLFYAINKWLYTKKTVWIWVIVWTSLMIFLSVTRQIIVLSAVLGLFFFFRRISLYKKLLLSAATVVVLVFVMPHVPVYKTMIEFSEDQRDENDYEENIRITAWRYYTYEKQENAATAIFGNGVPSIGNSRWGTMFDSETEVLGVFAADVGWAGFYWYFGIFATGALLYILVRAIMKPKKPDEEYITYWLILILITDVACGIIVYYFQIINVAVVLAMTYHLRQTRPHDAPQVVTESACGNPEIPINQLIKKYPQLYK